MWTTIKSDRGFISLTGIERSGFLQCIIDAKMQRDNGTVLYRNCTAMGHEWGVDGRTADKIATKLRDSCNWGYTKFKDGGVQIKIRNYKKWQEIDAKEMSQKYRKSATKMQPLRPDQTRPDHTKAVSYFCDLYLKKIGSKYDFKDSKDAAIIKRLLRTFGLEKLMAIFDQAFVTDDEWLKQAGVNLGTISVKANKLAQEVARKEKFKPEPKPVEQPLSKEDMAWGRMMATLAVKAVARGKQIDWPTVESTAKEQKFSDELIDKKKQEWERYGEAPKT